MRFKNNVLAQYTLTVFLITGFLSAGLAVLLVNDVESYLMTSHIQVFPQIIALAFHEDSETDAWVARGTPSAPPTRLVVRLVRLKQLNHFLSMRVFGLDGQLLWSDEPSLSGTKESSLPFTQARQGTSNYTRSTGEVLEIFTPVHQAQKVVAVVELRERNLELFVEMGRNTRDIWVLVGVSSLVLYASLFFVYYRSYRNQQRGLLALERTQEATVFALAYEAELRDHETGRHLERTARYVDLLAGALKLPADFRSDLVRAAPLHDIGKVGVPDAILLKAGPLTPEERLVIETHCQLGDSVLAAAEAKLPFRSFLTTARAIVLNHHEKWDGSGYPRGLAGQAIPLAGRIMAVADVYDALRSRRPYKEAQPHDVVRREVERLAGTQFDPQVVGAFLTVAQDFRRVSEEWESVLTAAPLVDLVT